MLHDVVALIRGGVSSSDRGLNRGVHRNRSRTDFQAPAPGEALGERAQTLLQNGPAVLHRRAPGGALTCSARCSSVRRGGARSRRARAYPLCGVPGIKERDTSLNVKVSAYTKEWCSLECSDTGGRLVATGYMKEKRRLVHAAEFSEPPVGQSQPVISAMATQQACASGTMLRRCLYLTARQAVASPS